MKSFLAPRFFLIALVVGTLLNLINQGDQLLSGATPDYSKLVLTYCVPYMVACFSSWLTLQREKQG